MPCYLTAIAIAAATMSVMPAWAIFKCPAPNGRLVFQDTPCLAGGGERLDVRPSSGQQAPTGTTRMTETQRLQANIDDMQKQRRRHEIESSLLPNDEEELRRVRQECDADIARLQARKSHANNNLAGATWQVSLSGEMTAIATRCDTRQRELKESIDSLRKECSALAGCK